MLVSHAIVIAFGLALAQGSAGVDPCQRAGSPRGSIGSEHNLDFGVSASSVPTNASGASPGQVGTWNLANSTASFQFLDDTAGASTGVTITVTGSATDLDVDHPATSGDDERLIDDALRFSSSVTLSIGGLHFGDYSVIVYAWAPDNPSLQTSVQVTGGPLGAQVCGGTTPSPFQHQYGVTYVMDTLRQAASIDVVLTPVAGSGTCNGIQIVPFSSSLGTVLAPPAVDLLALTGNPECHAVEFGWGYLWVTGESVGSGPVLYQLDPSLTSPIATSPTVGIGRDMASKDSAREIFLATGSQTVYVYEYDWNGSQIACTAISVPVAVNGIAYDPAMDHFYVSTPAGQIAEFDNDLTTLIREFPPAGRPWWSLAWDSARGNLWACARSNPAGGTINLVEVHELNISGGTGQPTGRAFVGDSSLPANNVAGGCDVIVDPATGTIAMWVVQESTAPAADHLLEYDLVTPFCDGSVRFYCTPGTTANGCHATLSSSGAPVASLGSGFTISATDVEGAKQGLLFYGVSGPLAQPWGAGTSYLCVAPQTQRTPAQDSGGVAGSCDGVFSLDWSAYVASNPGAVGTPFLGGETVWAQAWFRDPPSPKTTSLSHAIEFIVCQ